jgi:hypothetical protein
MTTRQDITDALNDTGLVSATAYRPDVVAPGQAWPDVPTLVSSGAGWGFGREWTVTVLLPGSDPGNAARWWDAHLEDLLVALGSVIAVDRAEPTTFTTEGGTLYAATITGRSE